MQKLSLSKQLAVVRLYLSAFSYDEIAARAQVSKGTVANIIADLKAGQFPVAGDVAEQLELLRELAGDLRRTKLTLGQAVTHIAIMSHLQELGIEPADVERWAAMCRELASQGMEAQLFVRAALYLQQLRESTGLSAQALEEKACSLEEKVARLEPLAQKLEGCPQALEQLEGQRQSLADEVSELGRQLDSLRKDVAQKEKREQELSHHVQDLEHRAQAADERLAAARGELKALAALGISLDELPGLFQRLAGVAHRHGIKPAALMGRLLHELEQLDAALGLETLVESKRAEMSRIEQDIVKAQQEQATLESLIKRLRQEQARLHAAISEEQKFVRKETRAIATIVRDATTELKRELKNSMAESLAEVGDLRNQALELGKELGRFEATIEANQWLQTLVALVKRDGSTTAKDARAVGLAVLRGMKGWMEQNQSQVSLPSGLTMRLNSIIEDLERWKT